MTAITSEIVAWKVRMKGGGGGDGRERKVI